MCRFSYYERSRGRTKDVRQVGSGKPGEEAELTNVARVEHDTQLAGELIAKLVSQPGAGVQLYAILMSRVIRACYQGISIWRFNVQA
jgi:hypothetical protein